MGHIICVTARKDGAGKTTTAINLSAAFSIAEKKTLLVDCDPIGHASTGLGVDETLITNSLYQGMAGKVPIAKLIINKGSGYPDLIPGKLDLYRFPVGTENNKESVLCNILADVKNLYDYIVIDTPQIPVILMINAFVAAELLLITIPCEYLALAGFGYLFDTLQMVKNGFGLKNDIAGILITKMNKQEKSSRLIAEELRNRFKNIIFDTSIPTCGKLRSSPAYGKPVFMTDIKSAGARSYLKLASEIMNKWNNITLKQ